MSTSNPHSTEEYYCTTCKDFKELEQVRSDWKCPTCKECTDKVITDMKDQSCFRVPVQN
jgi:DNA-directed RNA polymerase subunit RPC12/RpoP